MSSKASIDTLNTLHDLQTQYYLQLLQAGLSGEVELKPTELSAINVWLKQNDITADPIESKLNHFIS